MGARILYLGYWSIAEPLTQSVIMPRLKVLAAHEQVETVIFMSVERGDNPVAPALPHQVQWMPFRSVYRLGVFATKIFDFVNLPVRIRRLIKSERINLVIANSPLAGAACLPAARNVPKIVECFEPHAEYMLQSGVWNRWDPRYLFLRYMEGIQKKRAWKLQVVSDNHRSELLSKGISKDKIEMLANCVDINRFRFDPDMRAQLRTKWGWSDQDIVGIYVGKFGGIYYQDEAFDLFRRANDYFAERFRLIILTEHPEQAIDQLGKRFFSPDNFRVMRVPHPEVGNYLSAADFAFATIKPAPVRRFCCPVKDGEYWANGLPVLLEEGVGDDSDIIKNDGGGLILNFNRPEETFAKLAHLLSVGRFGLNQTILSVAVRYRSMDLVVSYYNRVLESFANQKFTT